MILRRIKLRNYRGIEQREIELSPGVNVIEGPNEAGKTSLAEALRLIFEFPDSSSHRSISATHPVHRDEGPEIDVQLETGDYELVYHKRYKRRPETTLEVRRPRPESLTGRDAHARAEEILRETIDVGLWRALQLQQGAAIEQADLRDREALSRALDAAAGSDGDDDGERGALFDRVHAEYLRYYTEKGRVRSDRSELRAELDASLSQIVELESRQRELARDVEEAERLAGSLRELKGRLPELESQAAQLATEWAAVVRQREQLTHAERNVEAARLHSDAAQQAQKERSRLARDVEAAATRRATLEKQMESDNGPLRRAEIRWQELRDLETLARRQVEASDARARTLQAAREILRAESELKRTLEQIQRAEELERTLQAALESAKAIRVDDAALRALQQAELDVRQSRARLAEGGTRVELHALADTEIALTTSAQPAAAPAERLERGATRSYAVDEALTLCIPGSLEIRVLERDAGAEGETLHAAAARASQQRDRLLAQLGVDSTAAAELAKDERERAMQSVEWARGSLQQALAGASLSELRAEASTLRETLARLQPDSDASPPQEDADEASAADALRQAQEQHQRATARFDQTSAEAENARAGLEQLRLDQMRLQGGVESALAQTTALADRLALQRQSRPDETLADRVRETGREVATAESQALQLREALAALDAERLEALHGNAEDVLQTARAEQHDQQLSLAGVTARLEAQQEAGLFEALERQRARASAQQRTHDSLERRARAARRLYLELCHQRERAREQYLKPLREQIERLGRIVFGATFSVALDAGLRIESRTLEGRTVDFESLSTGAQEQIGLLTRLAVAITVAPEGGVPLILDDALGNSDSSRLQSMGAMIAQAGRECQIIVLTCSPERFRHVGRARVQRLSRPASA